MLTQRDGCSGLPLHVAVVMNDSLGVMELLHLGVPTQMRDIRGLTPAVSARNGGSFFEDLIDPALLGQWVVLKRVRALVPCDTADPRAIPLDPADTIAVVWENPSGWAVGINAAGRCGVFPIDKCCMTDMTTSAPSYQTR